MKKRSYRLKDVYDYLVEYYGLEWRGYQIKDYNFNENDPERGLRAWDFNSTKTSFWVVGIVYDGAKRKTVSLDVSNDNLVIYEITPYLHHYKAPEIEWKDYLVQKYNQGQAL